MEQCKNPSSLCDIDFVDTKNQSKKEESGFGASRLLDEKIKRDEINQHDIKAFRGNFGFSAILNLQFCGKVSY